jgi:hypothetical protein
VRALLRLATRPYAHTGTTRLVASLTGTGPQEFSATGLVGDAPAQANIEVRVGSVVNTDYFIALGVHNSASFVAVRPGASIAERIASTSVVGASGRISSQVLSLPISATAITKDLSAAAPTPILRDYLVPPDGHVGRLRVLAVVRSHLYPATALTLYAKDRFGAILGATVTATSINTADGAGATSQYAVLDLGEVQVPARSSGQEAVPTQYVEIWGGGASGASMLASPGMNLNALIYLPIGNSAAISRPTSIAARDWVRLESVPAVRSIIGNASVYKGEAPVRGGAPQLTPGGSPGASGAPRLVVFAGRQWNHLGNDVVNVAMTVRERFTYLR